MIDHWFPASTSKNFWGGSAPLWPPPGAATRKQQEQRKQQDPKPDQGASGGREKKHLCS